MVTPPERSWSGAMSSAPSEACPLAHASVIVVGSGAVTVCIPGQPPARSEAGKEGGATVTTGRPRETGTLTGVSIDSRPPTLQLSSKATTSGRTPGSIVCAVC